MKRKTLSILLTISMTAALLSGCKNAESVENSETIEAAAIESEVDEMGSINPISKDALAPLSWEPLGSLTTYNSLRTEWDNILGVTGTPGNKEGLFFMGYEGPTQDSFLAQVIQFQVFADLISDETIYDALVEAVRNHFADSDELTDQQLFSIGLNAYFNLLPMKDESATYANEYVSRAQFLSIVARATYPSSVKDDAEFETNVEALNNQIGDSVYNESVAVSLDYSYLTLEDGSLNSDTYESPISRGEAIYTIMQMIYGEDILSTVNLDSAVFTDTTNGGDLASQNDLDSKAQVIQRALQNPDQGCPEDIYRALAEANEVGLIGDETAWDEAVTLLDAITLYYDIVTSRMDTRFGINPSRSNVQATPNDEIARSEGWADYKRTMEYYVEHGYMNITAARMMNPDVYGTEVTKGKSSKQISTGTGSPDLGIYIKQVKLTTTKGFHIEAYWYTETNTVQYIYVGEVLPGGGVWFSDMDSMTVLGDAFNNEKTLLDMTHQERIDILGEPSLTPKEVIEIASNGTIGYTKRLILKTTKGFDIQAFWNMEDNTVQYVYAGDTDPYGTRSSFLRSAETLALKGKYGASQQEKMEILGEPSMTPEEVIEAISNGIIDAR